MDDHNKQTKQPKVYFERLQFNDGSSITLNENSIVVFTGANNCGKSQVLRELENRVNPNSGSRSIILSNCEMSFCRDIEHKPFLQSMFDQDGQGNYHFP